MMGRRRCARATGIPLVTHPKVHAGTDSAALGTTTVSSPITRQVILPSTQYGRVKGRGGSRAAALTCTGPRQTPEGDTVDAEGLDCIPVDDCGYNTVHL